MNNTHKVLLIAILTSSTLLVQAQGIPFADFDADKNGTVSEKEFNEAKNQNIAAKAKEGRKMRGLANAPTFSSIDTNRDGQLSKEEMNVMQLQHAKTEQGDKKMARPPKPVFTDFDMNNDNMLTEKEFNEARNKRIGDRAKEGRQMKGLANVAAFADIDGNADGKVSQEEFTSFLAEHEKQAH